MHLMGTGAERINFGFVAVRWQSPLLAHVGLDAADARARARDQRLAQHHAGLRDAGPGCVSTINMVSYVIGFTLMVLGTVIVVSFDPSKWPGAV